MSEILRNQARLELIRLLRNISEGAVCAQWYNDIESIIWDRLENSPSRLGQINLTKTFFSGFQRSANKQGDGPSITRKRTKKARTSEILHREFTANQPARIDDYLCPRTK